MTCIILPLTSASISEQKKSQMATASAEEGYPVTILHRNQPVSYCVPAELYEKMLNALDNLELVKLVAERSNQLLYDVVLDRCL